MTVCMRDCCMLEDSCGRWTFCHVFLHGRGGMELVSVVVVSVVVGVGRGWYCACMYVVRYLPCGLELAGGWVRNQMEGMRGAGCRLSCLFDVGCLH